MLSTPVHTLHLRAQVAALARIIAEPTVVGLERNLFSDPFLLQAVQGRFDLLEFALLAGELFYVIFHLYNGNNVVIFLILLIPQVFYTLVTSISRFGFSSP